MLARLYMDAVMTNESEQMKELLIIASERLSEEQYSLFLSALAQRIYADQVGGAVGCRHDPG